MVNLFSLKSHLLSSQSISLTNPLVAGAQLINQSNNVIRASMAPASQTISSTSGARQILLPQGQTVINRQQTPQGAIQKNVVLRQLQPNMSPVIVSK